jgi:hypothetical protein
MSRLTSPATREETLHFSFPSNPSLLRETLFPSLRLKWGLFIDACAILHFNANCSGNTHEEDDDQRGIQGSFVPDWPKMPPKQSIFTLVTDREGRAGGANFPKLLLA